MLATGLLLALYCCHPAGEKNRLSAASSPYLRLHADNPVAWYEWGDEGLGKAKKENKPLLISIGYASCHWCHVMEKESFMDTAVARIMNENFVCIKVDREERPDIDNIYMNACQLISGSAGWPLHAFALPDGKPFFAGTYYTRSGWMNLLKEIAKAYKEKNGLVVKQAEALTKGIVDEDVLSLAPANKGVGVSEASYQNLFDSLYKKIDTAEGGLKGAPKFPMPAMGEFLLQYHYFTGDKKALDAVTRTLTSMALGGIYDQVGGGFARYSTDSKWRIPHFEKMLYDNGQLVSLYAHAYQVTKDELFKNVLTETIAFVERELGSPQGGFYSSINADSEEGEGSFYAWSFADLQKYLGENQAGLIMTYFSALPAGNWKKGNNILYATGTPARFAAAKNILPANFVAMLQNARKMLLAERNKRTRPATDDKILTGWNAIMLRGYADAYCATGNPSYLSRALTNAAFLEKHMLGTDGHLWRNYKEGKASIDAFLDDYAWLSRAYIRLYQVTFDKHWLDLARRITGFVLANFYDSRSGMFYYTPVRSADLVVRKMEMSDNAIPSSNAVMAGVLYELSVYFENEDYRQKCAAMLGSIAGTMQRMTSYYAQWCSLAGLLSHGTYEVAVMGKDALNKNLELQRIYLPACVYMGETDEENLPLLEGKLTGEKTLIYVCTNRACKLPVEEPSKALNQMITGLKK
jgi:uncharacterized protein